MNIYESADEALREFDRTVYVGTNPPPGKHCYDTQEKADRARQRIVIGNATAHTLELLFDVFGAVGDGDFWYARRAQLLAEDWAVHTLALARREAT